MSFADRLREIGKEAKQNQARRTIAFIQRKCVEVASVQSSHFFSHPKRCPFVERGLTTLDLTWEFHRQLNGPYGYTVSWFEKKKDESDDDDDENPDPPPYNNDD